MQRKTVIFDLDDTLYTDWRDCDDAGLAAVGAYGERMLGLAPAETVRAFREGRAQAIRRLGPIGSAHNRALWAQLALEALGQNPLPHAEALHNDYWGGVFEKMTLDPAVPPLLDTLHKAGVRTAVCTNMMADIQMRKLVRLGLADAIDCFVTSEEAGADKPSPDIFLYTLRKAGGTAKAAFMVGDSYAHDVAGAQAAGVPCIWINRAGTPMPEGGGPPVHEVRSMAEAAEILTVWSRGDD